MTEKLTTDPTLPEPRGVALPLPRARWMLLGTAVLLVLWFVLWLAVPICRQQAAIRAVEANGGYVETARSELVPDRLRAIIGEERIRCVEAVDTVVLRMHDIRKSDECLTQVLALGTVQDLALVDTPISNEMLSALRELPRLRGLSFDRCPITDETLASVGQLTALRSLNLANTPITDAGLVFLRSMSNLQVVNLNGTAITDAGLSHLQGVARLTGLHVTDTQVTEAGISRLQEALPGIKIDK